jgi:Rrf2 family cysteine metabolism transcriptional repressor
MELSLKSEYAILALLELTKHYGQEHPLQIKQIAQSQNIPDRYLEQLLIALKKHGLVKSQRGAKGGYILAKEPWQINMLDIIRAVEGNDPFVPRKPQNQPVSSYLAVVLDMWQSAQTAAESVLKECTLKHLSELEKQKRDQSVMYYI